MYQKFDCKFEINSIVISNLTKKKHTIRMENRWLIEMWLAVQRLYGLDVESKSLSFNN